MFDDMMHRGLWFAPTWPMMRERAAGYLLSGIELDIKPIDADADTACTAVGLLSAMGRVSHFLYSGSRTGSVS